MKYTVLCLALAGLLTGAAWAQESEIDKGIDLYRAGKFADSVRALEPAVEAEPESTPGHLYLGLARLGLGRIPEAEAALNRARELAPDSDEVKVGQARVAIEKREFDNAETLLREAREANGDNPEVPLYMGALRVAQRNYQAGLDELNVAIDRKPDLAYAHYYSGLAHNALKRPDKMVESFQKFLKLAPNAPEADRVRSLLRNVR